MTRSLLPVLGLIYLASVVQTPGTLAAECGQCLSLRGTEDPGRWGPNSITYIYQNMCYAHVSAKFHEGNGGTTSEAWEKGQTRIISCTSGDCPYNKVEETCTAPGGEPFPPQAVPLRPNSGNDGGTQQRTADLPPAATGDPMRDAAARWAYCDVEQKRYDEGCADLWGGNVDAKTLCTSQNLSAKYNCRDSSGPFIPAADLRPKETSAPASPASVSATPLRESAGNRMCTVFSARCFGHCKSPDQMYREISESGCTLDPNSPLGRQVARWRQRAAPGSKSDQRANPSAQPVYCPGATGPSSGPPGCICRPYLVASPGGTTCYRP